MDSSLLISITNINTKNKSSTNRRCRLPQRLKFKCMRIAPHAVIASALLSLSLLPLKAQTIQVIETRADGSALLVHHQTDFVSSPVPASTATIVIDDSIHFQRMEGFGASLTDSSAALLMQLPVAQRDALMQEIFDPAGPLALTLLRQPIGASDFSAHGDYSYDDPPDSKPDPGLAAFSTATDGTALFPLLRQALHLDPQLRLMILPWSAPAWMKGPHTMHGGSLDNAYIPVYAQYLARTVEAYASEALPVFAVALQNEPLNVNATYPTQHMDPAQETHLAAALQPLLWKDGRDPKLIGYEHNWNTLDYPNKLLAEAATLTAPNAPPLFSAISFHCYAGDPSAQLTFLKAHPDTPIWFTECSGTNGTVFANDLIWQAQHLILGTTLNEARTVSLWNILLDPRGGPHNGGCNDCRALFTLETHDGAPSLHRNVEYYELAHAAPFIRPGAVRISAIADRGLETAAFQNPDGTFALLVLNTSPRDTHVAIKWHSYTAAYDAPARSLLTFSWGKSVPELTDGTYRIAASAGATRVLETNTNSSPTLAVPASTPASIAHQLWTIHRLPNGDFAVRNLATAQSLAIASTGKLSTLATDGLHVAPLTLTLQGNAVCLAVPQKHPCTEAPATADTLRIGNLLYLIAAPEDSISDKK